MAGKGTLTITTGSNASAAVISVAKANWDSSAAHAEIKSAVAPMGYTNSSHDELFAVHSGQPLPVKQAPESTIYSGSKDVTTGGSPEDLASTQALNVGVWVKAKAANTGVIYVGPNGSVNFELSAKESVFIPVADLATVEVDAAVSSEGVTYIAF